MSSQRVNTTELVKLLNLAGRPIYVLDEDLTVVFINRACRDWLGAAAEGLLGLCCAYHSSPAVVGADAVAAGLCPPPRVLSGECVTATVSLATKDETLVERRARFLPLGFDGEDVLGIVVVLDATNQSSADRGNSCGTGTNEPGPIALHEHLRRFRREAVARYRANRLVGQGPIMQLARRQVELAAAGQANVLLVGPPGSGRQHLAAAIHYGANLSTPNSESAGPLTPLDCSLLGVDLLDAVVAAVAREAILDEPAIPSSLLLHRVDEVPVDVQVQLMEFFARRPPRHRLMASASEPLNDLARRGKFNAGLAALLSTIMIELPPLAERREDLPLLAQLFLEECNAVGTRQIGGFSQTALDRLDAYSWPGNLDELAQVVAQSHQRTAGPEISPEDLPQKIHLATQAAAQPRRVEETINLDEYLGRIERELIRRALARAKGNKARAARWLGLTRPRLYRRMVQLGLE